MKILEYKVICEPQLSQLEREVTEWVRGDSDWYIHGELKIELSEKGDRYYQVLVKKTECIHRYGLFDSDENDANSPLMRKCIRCGEVQ